MILFGRKDKYIATKTNPKEVCSECNKKGGVVSLFQIYFHIFLLPIIPISRKAASQCLNCKHIKTQRFFNEEQLKDAEQLKEDNKTPLWTMIGGAILLVLLIIKLVLKFT